MTQSGYPSALQHLDATKRMVLRVRVPLVVEVVEQRNETPVILVLAVQACVSTHRSFDGEHVLAQALARSPFGYERPGIFSSWHSHNARLKPRLHNLPQSGSTLVGPTYGRVKCGLCSMIAACA